MPEIVFTKMLLHKGVALIYLFAFLVSFNQFKALCGHQGLLPIQLFMKNRSFKDCPSLFLFKTSDWFSSSLSFLGIILSLLALTGISDSYGPILSFSVWILLWVIYSSFVNAGQAFYGFGWETMLLEMGFLTIFLGPDTVQTPYIIFILFQWLLFRNMFGAGMIKLRGDECWKKLTCLYYHFETQPIPNPLSRWAHFLPRWILRMGVLGNHIVEIIIPFFYFLPPPFRYIAGGATIFFQGSLIFTGNFSWLNYITVIMSLACFDDVFFNLFFNLSSYEHVASSGPIYWSIAIILFLFIAYLSIRPIKNLFSSRQAMNCSFDRFHIVNTYGAFGSITRPRYELVVEGTDDEIETSDEISWKTYDFKGKPSDLYQKPTIIAPYHLRLDWHMWFAAMSSHLQHPWIVHLVYKFLINDQQILKLIKKNPFEKRAPKYVRIQRYIYTFRHPSSGSRAYWEREFVGKYLPPMQIGHPILEKFKSAYGWDQV